MVSTAGIIMPCGCLVTATIVFCPVKLCASSNASTSARITIAIDATVIRRVCDVEIVVHIALSAREIHVPLGTTT
jgi:hypothetical protein